MQGELKDVLNQPPKEMGSQRSVTVFSERTKKPDLIGRVPLPYCEPMVNIRFGLTFKTIMLLFAGDVEDFNLFTGLPKRLKEKHRGQPLAVSGYSDRANQSVFLIIADLFPNNDHLTITIKINYRG